MSLLQLENCHVREVRENFKNDWKPLIYLKSAGRKSSFLTVEQSAFKTLFNINMLNFRKRVSAWVSTLSSPLIKINLMREHADCERFQRLPKCSPGYSTRRFEVLAHSQHFATNIQWAMEFVLKEKDDWHEAALALFTLFPRNKLNDLKTTGLLKLAWPLLRRTWTQFGRLWATSYMSNLYKIYWWSFGEAQNLDV